MFIFERFSFSLYLTFKTSIPAQHLQRSPAAGVTLPQGWNSGTASTLQACQKLRLQSLQLERERLKQRQHEIRLQVYYIQHAII